MKHILTIFLLAVASTALAQSYTLTGSVEPVVHEGENFKLRYTVNTTDASDFRLGTLPDALEVLIGPSQSTSISSVSVNGHLTTSSTLTLTYVLSANATGQFTIPPATVTAGGHTVKSAPLTLQVIPASGGSQGNATPHQGATSSRRITSNDFFVLVTATKKHVTLYEPLLLTFKVCWHPDLPVVNLDDISLELQNVYMQPYNDTQQKSKKVEQIGGRTLVTVDWKQYVVYPQQAGKLLIPNQKFTGYVRQDQMFDPFDPFSASYSEVPFQLSTPPLEIQVDDLPERPADFSGGVGRLSMQVSPDKTELKANTPVTLTVVVSGRGNLNMLKQPIVSFPRTFDTYDTRQNEHTHLTADGIDGDVTYEFVAVPQREGRYTLPPVRLVYFDTGSRQYTTLTSDSIRLTVTPGDGNSGTSVHDFTGDGDERPGDIRPVKTGPQQPVSNSRHQFMGSTPHLVSLAAIFLAFAAIFLYLRSRASHLADVAGSRAGRATRVATSRLRKAARLMKSGNTGQFYDETLRALWGYVGDKLNMPVSQLTRDNISQRLEERDVTHQATTLFIEAIDDCEFVRYAPGDPQGNMDKVYQKSKTAIEQIDQQIKKVKRHHTPAAPLLLLLLLLSVPSMAVPTKEQADDAYAASDYEQAIEIYTQLEASADVCYNLANAYFRIGDMAHAILYYERVLLQSPGDDDARYNLQVANSKTIDKIPAEREMFFVTWYHALVRWLSADAWAILATVSVALSLLLLLIYFFSQPVMLRKAGFYGALLFASLFLLGHLFAWQQKSDLSKRNGAVIMASEAEVMSSPAAGSKVFTLHAGTKVTISDDTMDDWKQVTLSDGRQGWVLSTLLERI